MASRVARAALAGGDGEMLVAAGVEDGTRRIDHQAGAAGGAAGRHGRFDVAALGADARHQQRHVADDRAHAGDLGREGGADDEADLAAAVPFAGSEAGDALVEPLLGAGAADVEELQVGAAGVGGAAEQDDALVGIGQVRLDRIAAHVGVDRDGVGLVAREGL